MASRIAEWNKRKKKRTVHKERTEGKKAILNGLEDCDDSGIDTRQQEASTEEESDDALKALQHHQEETDESSQVAA